MLEKSLQHSGMASRILNAHSRETLHSCKPRGMRYFSLLTRKQKNRKNTLFSHCWLNCSGKINLYSIDRGWNWLLTQSNIQSIFNSTVISKNFKILIALFWYWRICLHLTHFSPFPAVLLNSSSPLFHSLCVLLITTFAFISPFALTRLCQQIISSLLFWTI